MISQSIYRIDEREDRARPANSQREREDGTGRERGRRPNCLAAM